MTATCMSPKKDGVQVSNCFLVLLHESGLIGGEISERDLERKKGPLHRVVANILLFLAVCPLKMSFLPNYEGKYEDSEGSQTKMCPFLVIC